MKIDNSRTNSTKGYQFDQVFDESATQEAIFKRTRAEYLIKQVLTGFHATIFVYGQTGSGKTFTMEGYKYARPQPVSQAPGMAPPHPAPIINRKSATVESAAGVEDASLQAALTEEGIIPRAIRELFEQVKKKREETQTKITIKVQYIQLYNEKVYDLLNSNAQKKAFDGKKKPTQSQGLKLKMNALTDEVTIENVYIFECSSMEDGFKYFWKGLKNKVMSSHNMNQSSSRSHCILTFIVYQQDLSKNDPSAQIVSKLQLVDLAGSERQSHTTNFD